MTSLKKITGNYDTDHFDDPFVILIENSFGISFVNLSNNFFGNSESPERISKEIRKEAVSSDRIAEGNW